MSPFWGFQGLLAIGFSIALKLNKTISFLFSNISIPPFIPFIVLASVKIGELLLGENIDFDIRNFENIKMLTHLKVYVVGSLFLALSLAILLGVVSFVLLKMFNSKRINE